MAHSYPLCDNSYWEEKIAQVEKIEIPAYVVASYTNSTHTPGTFDGWCNISSKDKWLRVHNAHEWNDLYNNHQDLQRFFDHYLKGEENGWESTPRVRLSVLDPGGEDIIDRPEESFPLPHTSYTPLYLDAASGSLSTAPAQTESLGEYNSESDEQLVFTYEFPKDTELTGFMALTLWVSAESAADMDIFVHVEKTDAEERLLSPMVYGAAESGPQGMAFRGSFGAVRTSLRRLDPIKSRPYRPYLSLNKAEHLSPGEIVPVTLPLSPLGMMYRKGQRLKITVCGYPLDMPREAASIQNCGKHRIHTGEAFDSHLLVPVVG